MIHRKKGRKLKRTSSHRSSLMSNLSVELIKNKKIRTTLAKAKELRTYIEPIINRSKKVYLNKDNSAGMVHARRYAYGFLKDRSAVKTLFDEIAPKVAERNGGYTRVLKIGRRLGDGAEMAVIELVDYNAARLSEETDTEKKGSKADKRKKRKESTKSDYGVSEQQS